MPKIVIPVSNKEFDIIDSMTRKEVREARRLMTPFIGFDQKLQTATQEQIAQILKDIENRGAEADSFMFRVFSHCIAGMSQQYFEDEMRNVEALILFNAIWRASTEIPLEFVKPSASSSAMDSPKTPNTSSQKP